MPYFGCVKIIYFRWPAVLSTYLLIMKYGGVIYSVTKASYTHLILLTPVNMTQRYVSQMKIYSENISPWKKNNFVNSAYKFGLQYKGYTVLW